MKRSGKILLEGTIEEFKKHCKGADNREYLLINTKEIKKDGTYTIYQLDSNTERVTSISAKGKYGKLPFIPYDKQYLTFIALSDGTFSWTGQTNGGASNCLISYSLDGGNIWSAPSITVNIEVKTNDKVLWRGDMYPGNGGTPDWYGIGSFGGSASFIAQGNPKSLLYSNNFSNLILKGSCTFKSLFLGTKVVDTANLIMDTILTPSCYNSMFRDCTLLIEPPQLPATTLTATCYSSMFEGCTSLTKAPDLIAPLVCVVSPAWGIYSTSYELMFKGCTNLSYVKVLAEDFDMDGYSLGFSSWLLDVAEIGIFVKSPNMTSLPTGVDGIPTGWTVQDATE